jgi:Domain of unknown function (DUF4269)
MICRPASKAHGSEMNYEEALQGSQIIELLQGFDPQVAGTFPLGLAIATSDIDVICHAPAVPALADRIWLHFRHCEDFRLYQWTSANRSVVTRFRYGGFLFEIFGDARPVAEHEAWRHFDVERRLLALDDGHLRSSVSKLRASGMKTEPAFAAAMMLDGDPYAVLLTLSFESNDQLFSRLRRVPA